MDILHRERSASMQQDKGAAVAGRSGSLVSGTKSKRHTWSFLNVSRAVESPLSPQRSHEQGSPAVLRRRAPSSGSSSAPQTRVSSPERQPQPRPCSSRGSPSSRSLQVPNFSKTFTTRPASRGLPTILESKAKSASMESLRSRVDGSRVKRWDGNTRTTSPWNGILKVSLTIKRCNNN